MKIQGQEILSPETLRSARRAMLVSAVVILVKGYGVSLEANSIFGVAIEPHLFDSVALVGLLFGAVLFFYGWTGDIVAYTKWYQERSIWSQFDTNMTIDRKWYDRGARLLVRLYENENLVKDGATPDDLPEDARDLYRDFKNNVELYRRRLEEHQTSFRTVSALGWFYIVGLWGLLPVLVTGLALWYLFADGLFEMPNFPAWSSEGVQGSTGLT